MELYEALGHEGETLVHKFLDKLAVEAELVDVGDGGALHVRLAGTTEVVTMHPRHFTLKSEVGDQRPYPAGNGNDARLMRWVRDNVPDPLVCEDGKGLVKMAGGDLYLLLSHVIDVFYWHGVDDTRLNPDRSS
jgi:hypothetical protein